MTNVVILHGRLTRDVELTYTQGDNSLAVGRFTIAVSRQGKDKGVDFINIVSFGKQAEVVNQYFKKGSEIVVTGKLQINNYEDKDGNKRTSANVILNEFDFAGTKKEGEQVQEVPEVEEDDYSSLPF